MIGPSSWLLRSAGVACATAGGVVLIALIASGCNEARFMPRPAVLQGAYAAQPAVANRGNLVFGREASVREIELAEFFFGVAPEPPAVFIKPMDVAAAGETTLVSDAGHGGVLAVSGRGSDLAGVRLDALPSAPTALARAPDQSLLVADSHGAVLRYDTSGALAARYVLPADAGAFRPAGIAAVGGEVWVSNAAMHRIEVFDAAGGAWRRSIGGRGRGPGQFGVPLALATTPTGNVLAVDMLGARVQVLSPQGEWLRDIGGPGDRPGHFGRPKGVAVGPDGTIFVTDAAAQCVHVFDADGRVLTSFGADTSDPDRLALPAGVAIHLGEVAAEKALPANFQPAYHVLVVEQMARPGVRAFAWRRVSPPAPPTPERPAVRRVAASVPNPHWRPDGCMECHPQRDGRSAEIPPQSVDRLCIGCHDGVKAVADAHPIGWPGVSEHTRTPADWPLVDGRLGCLTCHDIARHCDPAARRPTQNPGLVRNYDAARPNDFCANCHSAADWHVNPHTDNPQIGSRADTFCVLCHTVSLPVPAGGVRSGQPLLRQATTALCLNCHTMHADPAPQGHLGAAVEGVMLERMRGRAALRGGAGDASGSGVLPLEAGQVTCATCHNPHAPSVFPPHTPLGMRSAAAEDAPHALRLNYVDLCQECHAK